MKVKKAEVIDAPPKKKRRKRRKGGTGKIYFSKDTEDAIVEYNLMITKQGDQRGYHFHPHFDEYMLVVDGICEFTEYNKKGNNTVTLNVGDSIHIPTGTAHTFTALTDFKFVSMLTKRWHDSDPPIIKVDENGNTI